MKEISNVDIYQDQNILLKVDELKKYFPIKEGILRRVVGYIKAVNGVNFFVERGHTLGVVGESGCGKTTLGRCILRLLDPTEGSIKFRDSKTDQIIELADLTRNEVKPYRKKIQVIFQDPFSSLDDRMTIEDIVAEPLKAFNQGNKRTRKKIVAELLEKVGLSASHLDRYPHEFSGGQRQRIGIARALSLNPELIICDEPVSALDVSVQAQVINMLDKLQKEQKFTYLFIAHDLSVIEHISDRVIVMYLGKVVEQGTTADLFNNPQHPYTEALLAAIPSPDPTIKLNRELLLKGNVPEPSNPPSGCNFHPRCRYAAEKCKNTEPKLKLSQDDTQDNHYDACLYSDELDLKPAIKQSLKFR